MRFGSHRAVVAWRNHVETFHDSRIETCELIGRRRGMFAVWGAEGMWRIRSLLGR
jgi:hypothetical protein